MHLLEMEGKIQVGVLATNKFQLSEQRGYGTGLPPGTVGAKFSPALATVNVEFGQLMKGVSMTWLPVGDSATQELPSTWLQVRLTLHYQISVTGPESSTASCLSLWAGSACKRANGETKQDLWPLAIAILALHKCRCLRWASTSASAWERERKQDR